MQTVKHKLESIMASYRAYNISAVNIDCQRDDKKSKNDISDLSNQQMRKSFNEYLVCFL